MSAKTIVIFSTKGGVGKTFLALNIAASLSYYSRKKVALLDMDVRAAGDMGRWLNVNSAKTMLGLSRILEEKGREIAFKDGLVHLLELGLDFLPAVLKHSDAAHLSSEKIKSIFTFLEQEYDYIIVDGGNSFTEALVVAFNYANLILLVVTPDLLSVYQTKWAIDVLQSFKIPLSMIKLLLNRAQSLGGVTWQEVRAALPCEIIGRIPSEGKVVGFSLNRCIPVVVDSPSSKVAQAIRQVEKTLVTEEGLFVRRVDFDLTKTTKEEAKDIVTGDEFWSRLKLGPQAPTIEQQDKEEDEIILLKQRIYQRLIDKIDLKHIEIDMTDPNKAKQLREKTERVIAVALTEETGAFIASSEVRRRLIKEIADEALGLGPLEDLLNDPEITDIMVNNKNQVYIERQGKIELTSKRFISNEQVRQVIERIIAPLGRRIDESVPMVDARLPDGSRVNAIIPPLSLTGPTLTIRKFGKERLSIQDLLRLGTLTQEMADFLNACVVGRKNIVISGGTGSGKTTVLNVLSAFIPSGERIITIEDAAELKLKQEHWIRLESRPPNIEGKGAITTRDLFRNALRMRPDRIIIGECRGAETLDMLQAMNTGHDGSMTTIHANSTHDVLARMDSMILMSGVELPMRAIREMIASAVNIVVHTSRLFDGTRKIMQITEITGMEDEIHVGLKDIFVYKQTGVSPEGKALGFFTSTGHIPTFLEDLKVRGIELSPDLFRPKS